MAFTPDELNQLKSSYDAYQAAPKVPTQTAVAPQKKGGLAGIASNLGKSLIAAPKYFANTAIVNPTRELAAEFTHNKVAERNAEATSNETLGVTKNGKKQGASTGIKRLAGNTASLATTLVAPEAKAGLVAKTVQGAKIGAVSGAGGALAEDGSLRDAANGAVEGAAFGGALNGTAGVIGKTIGGVSKGAETRALSAADRQVQEKAAKYTDQFKSVPKSQREANGMNSVIKHFQDLDVDPTVQNLHAASNLVTGSDGIASGTTRQILGNLGHVDVAGVTDDAKAALVKEAGQLGNHEDKGSAANGVLRSIRNTLQGTTFKGEGSLSNKADANSVLDTIQSLESRVRDLGGVTAQGSNGAEARALKAARDSLHDKLAAGGADAAVAGHNLSLEDTEGIHKAVADAGGSGALSHHIINGINNAKSLGELRALQKPFVDASHLAASADKAGDGTLVKLDAETPDSTGDVANAGINMAMGNHFGAAQNITRAAKKSGVLDRAIGKAGAAADTATDLAGKNPVTANRADALLGQSIGRGTADNSGQPDQQTPSPDSETAGSAADPLGLGDSAADSQQGSAEPQFGKNELVAAIAQDPKNADTYMSLYKLFNADSDTKQSATQQKAALAANQASSTFNQIEDTYNKAGGGQGRLGGLVANLTGKVGLNDSAKAYNDTATSLGASLYKALGNTGTITDQDQKRISSLIPKTTDTAGEAKIKIDQLQTLLAEAQQNSMATT